MKLPIAVTLVACCAAPVLAQHHSPYAGNEHREIKALSPEQTKQYLSGAGMGYAMAAELNGFPGPMHVLELADRLELTPDQRAATQRLMDKHKADARAIGAKRVAAERQLDMLFRHGALGQEQLADAVLATARIDGEYRLSHLETHREVRALLSDAQVARYNELRGYAKK
jgi:hypothetical protein